MRLQPSLENQKKTQFLLDPESFVCMEGSAILVLCQGKLYWSGQSGRAVSWCRQALQA
jgi:hypothetical protein